jgi:hypothetical protein
MTKREWIIALVMIAFLVAAVLLFTYRFPMSN